MLIQKILYDGTSVTIVRINPSSPMPHACRKDQDELKAYLAVRLESPLYIYTGSGHKLE